MPPKARFTKEEIINSALEIVRKSGFDALTARSLGAKLGTSSQPIFTAFRNMEEVQSEVIAAADMIYRSYLKEEADKGIHPPYKSTGVGYIRFANEEKELFKLLFMRDRSGEEMSVAKDELKPFIAIIQKNVGISEQEAYRFHLEMWIYVHGIASMMATNYINWDMNFVSEALTDVYTGLLHRFCGK